MISIIVPTYNERENIEVLIKKVFEISKQSKLDLEVIVVDDDSPDLTWLAVEKLRAEYKNLQIIRRLSKKGLASAVINGLKISKGNIIGVIDADLSHPPELIPSLIEPLLAGRAEIAIASRYIAGGGIEKWSSTRKTISKAAILLAKPITRGIQDPISGYFFFKKEAIERVTLNPKGFKIGLEVIVKGKYNIAIEVPYIYKNRKKGRSKFGIHEVINYLLQLAKLYAQRF
jgi:dolichol-phosphate mannosyltransferase